ncbi:MAG: hypothetical protein AAB490_00145 [Patescibacteria group bacterium]
MVNKPAIEKIRKQLLYLGNKENFIIGQAINVDQKLKLPLKKEGVTDADFLNGLRFIIGQGYLAGYSHIEDLENVKLTALGYEWVDRIIPAPYLVQTSDKKKYIIQEGVAHWIPDAETRNALGLKKHQFRPIPDRTFEDYETRGNVDSVKSVKLIRDIANKNPVYALFNTPRIEKRYIPDPETLRSMDRSFDEIEDFESENFKNIPMGDPIVKSIEWDIQSKETDQKPDPVKIANSIIGSVNIGSNIKNRSNTQKNKFPFSKSNAPKNEKNWKWFITFAIPLAGVIIALLAWQHPKTSSLTPDMSQVVNGRIPIFTGSIFDLYNLIQESEKNSIEREEALMKYVGQQVNAVGFITDVSKNSNNNYRVTLRATSIPSKEIFDANFIICEADKSWKELETINLPANVKFQGIIAPNNFLTVSLTNCNFEF